jgi:hypothetical protein
MSNLPTDNTNAGDSRNIRGTGDLGSNQQIDRLTQEVSQLREMMLQLTTQGYGQGGPVRGERESRRVRVEGPRHRASQHSTAARLSFSHSTSSLECFQTFESLLRVVLLICLRDPWSLVHCPLPTLPKFWSNIRQQTKHNNTYLEERKSSLHGRADRGRHSISGKWRACP